MQFPQTPQAVIFDMDGLLIDTIPIYIAAMTEAGAQVGHPLSREYLVSLIGLLGQELHNRLTQDFGPDFPAEAVLRLTGERLAKTFAQGAPLKAGAAELVHQLHSLDMPLAVATSMKTAEAEHQLEMAGVRHCFVAVVGRDQVQRNKPNPDVYLEAASRLKQAPGACVALEDSFNGVRAAHAAGCMTIMVPDMLVPTAEIEALCVGIAQDLYTVKVAFEAG